MNGSPQNELSRCQPWLGTFVEVTASASLGASSNDDTQHALSAALESVKRIDELMSFFRSDSDVARLNREARYHAVAVHPWTFEVIALALRISRESQGAFDITATTPSSGAGVQSWEAIELLDHSSVRFHDRIQVDLGGIAKGFAVDRAVEVLMKAGVISGRVNAGGDLRVFGERSVDVCLRHPADPQRVSQVVALKDSALATSASYEETEETSRFASRAGIRSGGTSIGLGARSITVIAPECAWADALTKAVAILPETEASELLGRFGARAIVLATSPSLSTGS